MTVAAVAALAAGGGYAIAAGTSNTIRACASKTSGALRIASRCKSTESALSWNKVGPTGPRGAIGPQGPGAKLLVFNALAASASSTPKKIGTVGPWTIYGVCTVDGQDNVTANLGFTGPALTQDSWGTVSQNNTGNSVAPSTSAIPASALNTTGPEPLGGEGYASGTGTTMAFGGIYTFLSREGSYMQNIVVTATSLGTSQSNTCHASDAVTPLG